MITVRNGSVILVTLILFIFSSQPSFAKKFRVQSTEECVLDELGIIIQKDLDDVSLPKLPKSIKISVGKSEAETYFSDGVNRYRKSFTKKDAARLRDLAKKAREGGIITEEESDEISELRAMIKVMRYLFVALGDEHKLTPALDELATSAGKLRDDFDEGSYDETPAAGKRLLKAASKGSLDEIDSEIKAFKATTRKNFNQWLAKTITHAKSVLNQRTGPEGDLHQVRKDLQSILAVYQIRLARDPNDTLARTLNNYLTIQTENIGEALVVGEEKALSRVSREKKVNIKTLIIPYPVKLSQSILNFLNKVDLSDEH